MYNFAIGNSFTKQLNNFIMYEFRIRVYFKKKTDARCFAEVLKSHHWTDNCSLFLDEDYVSFSIKRIGLIHNAFVAYHNIQCSLNEICPKHSNYELYEVSFTK